MHDSFLHVIVGYSPIEHSSPALTTDEASVPLLHFWGNSKGVVGICREKDGSSELQLKSFNKQMGEIEP